MTYKNSICADAGTENCPCPLAETGDCLVCSRLAGENVCDCAWAGVCIYNEYMQNDRIIRNRRQNRPARVLKKIWYGSDLLVLVLQVPKGFALNAAKPGSFVFINAPEKNEFSNVPVSIMCADAEKGTLHLALKIISGKTKAIADAKEMLMLRGVYRNGLLGSGVTTLTDELHRSGFGEETAAKGKWLIMTKGVGFAPAVNLLRWAGGSVDVHLIVDTEKINEEMVNDNLRACSGIEKADVKITMDSLQNAGKYTAEDYDKVFILASDYYIKTIARQLAIPAHKLVFSNNFHMCCGEGICGACGHVDDVGSLSKMCKCKGLDVKKL